MNPLIKHIFLVFGIFCCIACTNEEIPAARGVLDILSSPEKYLGKQVTLDACYLSGRHGAAIYDCSNRELLLGVLIGENAMESAEGKLLVEQGYKQWPPGSRLVIHVRVDGELTRMDGGGVAFEILAVRDVTSS
ncbi:hypothetical protein P6166_02355 [Stenotrophomonas sp. HITSZ_GD]|uniref:hypothetical protein n=1 Tax=Stenotrophomonas sp. HITSZ_GD TaxID=3037248 RepID=UPI00240E0696|nr:hypothetical protein [Stenotrophomonas sp. HITSZ_GD]MDG2524200.1 hypothetical protein [Stenotrophomonas sp. HITSZ_GD]